MDTSCGTSVLKVNETFRHDDDVHLLLGDPTQHPDIFLRISAGRSGLRFQERHLNRNGRLRDRRRNGFRAELPLPGSGRRRHLQVDFRFEILDGRDGRRVDGDQVFRSR